MQVKDEMTSKVQVIDPSATVIDAARKMKEFDIGALPVCDSQRLVGIVTDRDITVRLTAAGRDPGSTRVDEVMSRDVQWCFDDDEVEVVAVKMGKRMIRRLPVINHEKKLVGMLSLGDIAARGSRMTACEILERVSVAA